MPAYEDADRRVAYRGPNSMAAWGVTRLIETRIIYTQLSVGIKEDEQIIDLT